MKHERWCRGALPVVVLLVASPQLPASAQDFPEVTAEQRAFSSFPAEPRAPAVELYRKGEFQLMDQSRQRMSSQLRVERRIKILTEEGRDRFSEFSVRHSRFTRLTDFAGRTVLPDGRVVSLDESAVFQEAVSERARRYVTKAALPAVEVGAIIDLRYSLRFESIFLLEPWDFQQDIPSLHSEIQYYVPEDIGMGAWDRVTVPGGQIQTESDRDGKGRRLRYWMNDVPSLPAEPMSFPAEDLSTRFMLYPAKIRLRGDLVPLFEDWRSTASFFSDEYKAAKKSSSKAKKRARELASAATGQRAKAEAVHAFVRDEIEDRFSGVVWVGNDFLVDDALRDGSADSPEKALLLVSMLDALGIDAEPVWTGYRSDGRIDPHLTTPYAFDNVVVRADLEGEAVWLDPTDGFLPFGSLDEENLGMLGLVVTDKAKDSELVQLPSQQGPAAWENATLDLEIDGEGRLSGQVEIRSTGYLARRSGLRDLSEEAREEWTRRVESSFGAKVSELEVTREKEDSELLVRMNIVVDAPAGTDELSLFLSQPHGPVISDFELPPEERVTPLLLEPPSRRALSVKLSWSEDWAVDLEPPNDRHNGFAGMFLGTLNLDEEARRLNYGRVLDVRQREFLDASQYAALRELFRIAEDHDSEALVLVRN